MRLTLRTVLAYLDDVLNPAEAKEMGKRIKESRQASEMVARIQEVVRRRRITAPEVSGAGSGPDPNVVAEYLDNCLESAAVMDYERLCQASDTHLAEAAACHQILTLVLGQPVEVAAGIRERMTALGMSAPTGEIDIPAVPEKAAAPVATTNGAAVKPVIVQVGAIAAKPQPSRVEHPKPEIPEYLKQTRSGGWMTTGTVVAVMVGVVWAVFTLTRSGTEPKTLAKNDTAAGSKLEKLVVPESGTAAAPDSVPTAAVTGSTTDVTPIATPKGTPESGELNAASVSETQESPVTTAEPMTPEPDPNTAADDALAKVDALQPSDATEMPPVPPAPMPVDEPKLPNAVAVVPAAPSTPAPVEDKVQAPLAFNAGADLPDVMYTSVEGVLLQHRESDGEWVSLPRRAMVHRGEEVACPEPFQADFELARGRFNVRLLGGSRITWESPEPQDLVGITVERGRVLLASGKLGDAFEPAHIRLIVGGRTYQVSLLEPETVVAVEVILRQPQGETPDPDLALVDGGLAALQGQAEVSQVGGEPVPLPLGGGLVVWPTELEGSVAFEPAKSLGAWATLEPTSLTPAVKTAVRNFEKEFAADQTVRESIPAVSNDKKAKSSELAVKTLALVDDTQELVRNLKSEHHESRIAAMDGLRSWLGRDPSRGEQIAAHIVMMFSEKDAPIVTRLLWGVPEIDVRTEEKSVELIDYLLHDNVTIRELAFQHIVFWTSKTNHYEADLPERQRYPAVQRWREQMKKTGALLAPASEVKKSASRFLRDVLIDR